MSFLSLFEWRGETEFPVVSVYDLIVKGRYLLTSDDTCLKEGTIGKYA